MRVTIVRNRHRKPNRPLSHNLQKHEVEVCRDKDMPEASLRNSIDRRVHASWKVLAPNRFVSIGILPNVSSVKRNRDASSALNAPFSIGRLKSNQTKSGRRMKAKVQLLLCGVHDSWVVYRRTLSRQILQRFPGRAKECWNQLDEYDSQGLHCVKQTSEKTKVSRWIKIQVKIPHQRSPYCKTRALRPRRCVGTCQENLKAPQGRQSHIPFTFWRVGCTSRIHNKTRGKHAHGQQKDLHEAELETVRVSKNPTVVMTPSGEVLAKEENWTYSWR